MTLSAEKIDCTNKKLQENIQVRRINKPQLVTMFTESLETLKISLTLAYRSRD
jgi:hypothetical protein